MLQKISALSRTLYILLAIVAGFVALGGLNVALVLLVLGLIAGISLPDDRMVLAGVAVVALPVIATVLGNIPTVGEQLGAIAGNLAVGIAGAFVTGLVIRLYRLSVEGVTGLAAK